MSSLKETMQTFAVNQALKYIEGNPDENLPKLMDMVDKFSPDDWYVEQRKAIRTAITEKNNWYRLVLKLYELDPGVRKAFFQNFLFNASFKGSAIQKENREKYGCNIPWAILLDPTSACNLHCTGCWAAEYGNRLNLSLETIDSIIRQGKELGRNLRQVRKERLTESSQDREKHLLLSVLVRYWDTPAILSVETVQKIAYTESKLKQAVINQKLAVSLKFVHIPFILL